MRIYTQGSPITHHKPGEGDSRESIYSDAPPPSSLPSNIINDNERVAVALVNEEGLVQKDGYHRNRVEIPVGMVVTDRHLVFAAVEGDGTDAGELSYAELAGIEVEGETLVLTTTDGLNWRFPLSEPESEPVDIAVRHLCWVGEIRNRLVSIENDIELAVGKIRTQSEEFAWDEALGTYHETRGRLDELISLVQVTTPLQDDVIAPELTDLDRRLESACARLFIERAESQLELAEQLLEYGDFEQARKVFEEVHDYYDRAHWHTEEVKRGDAFQFGRQRDLVHTLEELRWEIEAAAAEPLQQAKEAAVQAEAVDTLETEIEHLETALEQYRGARTLEWDDDHHFAGDVGAIDEELQQTAELLIERYEQAARNRWNDGSQLEANGQLESAMHECTVATEHLERAYDLAREFDSERAEKFESRLKQMFEMLLDMREADENAQGDADTTEGNRPGQHDSDADTRNGDGDSAKDASLSDIPESGRQRYDDLPSLDELTEMDLHHEITLDLQGDGDPLDDPLGVSEDDSSEEDSIEDRESEDGADHRRSNETESV